MKEKLTIVKVGGAIIDDTEKLGLVLDRLAHIEGRKLLVHGGGRKATSMAARLGIETTMVEGRRITDSQMLTVVVMVYAGLVNKGIVARLQALGAKAIGICGADLDIVRSHKRPLKNGIDYGYVGDVDRVDAETLSRLIEDGAVPVIAPISHDGWGQLLNTNADTIAQETAKALSAAYDTTLIYGFEKAGVLRNPDDPTSVIHNISAADCARLKADGVISGGMIPKIDNAQQAVAGGVGRVVITQATTLSITDGTVVR